MITLCNRKRLKFSDSEAESNFRQKWSEDDCVRGWYVAYKVVIALYFWSSLIWTWTQEENGAWYLIYMTSWGICTLNITILLDTSIVILKYVGVGVPDKLMTVSWLFCYIFYTAAVFITLLYWTMLYEVSEGPPTYFNLYVHGLQGLFVIIDQFVSNRQWHFEKIWTCLPFGVTYVIFNVIYWAAGGLDPSGNPWVYPVINWEEDPGNAMVTVAIGVVVCPLIHIFFWALTLFRNWIHRKLFLTTTLSIKTDSAYNNTAFNA